MIKKLRVRFIALSICSLLLVLTIIIGSINLLNYKKIVRDADGILSILAQHNGMFPKPEMEGPKEPAFAPMSPELPYESRFFSVLLDDEGVPVMVDTGRIAAVDEKMAEAYAKTVWERGDRKGFVKDYRYVRAGEEHADRIIFLDCGRNLSTFRMFFMTSIGISAAGSAAVLALIIALSGRIMGPVAESYEKQKRFITDAGHEIKTPLAVIHADADALELDIGENEWLSDIGRQTERLAELTDSLICLARMEEEQTKRQMAEFPLSDIVCETAQTFEALANNRGKTFVIRTEPALTLHGDEKAIRQLVSILLDNALKYSDEGGHILVTLKMQKKTACLCVYNTAESVSRESLEHIFDRFYRTDLSRSSKTSGYGIGLSIARAVVLAHKGKIRASTQDEKSLQITVLLPV